ncbi:MAG: methyl-accepting chemotaxis protein [Erythrobacter sp.]
MNMLSNQDQFTSSIDMDGEPYRFDEDVDFITGWFRRRSTGVKVLLVAGLPLLLVLVSAVLGYFGISAVEQGLLSESEEARAQAIETAETVRQTLIGTVIGGVGMFLLLMRIINTDVIRTSRQLIDTMQRISDRKLNVVVPHQDRIDEYGEVALAIEQFRQTNLEMIRKDEDRAASLERNLHDKDIAREQKNKLLESVASEFEQSIGNIIQGVASASTQLQTTAVNMASSAEESTRQTSEVANSMEEANAGATSAAAASDEFAMSIGEISRQAASSAELARKATHAATEADETISALSDSAEQVGEIVELIQTIAQRTNLLALNASIEAARGGEAGRGFAVVASEVKELAMQTSRATEQIAEQISSMQGTTGASVQALRSIAGQVNELETTAVSIASAVDQQSVAGQDLARSIDLAARSTDKVSSHIEDVRELSLSTGAAATQVLSSATDLEEQASTLNSQVQYFLDRVKAG